MTIDYEFLEGVLDSLENRCQALRCLPKGTKDSVYSTLLEDMLQDAQSLVDEICVVKTDGSQAHTDTVSEG